MVALFLLEYYRGIMMVGGFSVDERFMQRFWSYKRSLLAISDAGEQDLDNSYVISGIGSKFSITFELA